MTPESRTKRRRRRCSTTASTVFWRSSIWCSPKVMPVPSGADLMREDPCREAIRIGRLLDGLLPGRAAILGLLALMLLHDARRPTRATPDGDLVLLEDQDRALWDHRQIGEGLALVDRAPAPTRPAQLLRGAGGHRGRCTPARRVTGQPIGRRSSACTRCCSGCTPRPWSRSTMRSRCRWSTARRARSTCSMRSRRAAAWRIITCCRRRAPICCAGSDDAKKPGRLTAPRWRSPSSSPSARLLAKRLAELA